ncbi:MAG TPA: DNA polymerase III subunit alpha [Alphaproteobacteria bacterium]|jgi:DNA polymerase-3 subunit alpha
MDSATFIHLHAHSAYSLAEGAIRIKDLVGLCQEEKMPAVAVTDTGNLFGALEFATSAAKGGVQPIIGAQMRLGLEGHQLVLLAQSEEGWLNLSKLVSDSHIEGDPAQLPHTTWEKIEALNAGIICLTGGVKGPVGQYLLHNQPKEAETVLKKLMKIFKGRLYIELQRHGLRDENAIEEPLLDLAYKHNIPLVATNDCYFAAREMYEAHDALLCIADGRYITEENRRRETPEHYFKSAEEMRELFADLPEAVDNTVVIARRCHFLLKAINPILPKFQTQDGRTEVEELRAQAAAGLEWRLKEFVAPDIDHAPYRERLEYELEMIGRMGFPGYFLIVSDFIGWAKDHNIPVGPGRGSGAGSVVAWSLRITDLDPLRFGLLFERFLNPERVSMPDFDIDFCQERRDEVIRYVQDRYGRDRVAQIITFGKLQARNTVRDVGRVLQLPYGQVDRIAKMIPNNPANPVTLEEALLQDADLRAEIRKEEATEKLIAIALKLEGLYRHASTHAAGLVISDRPLHELVPLYRDPRSDMPVTQFNMKYVEQAGLVKFDFLGLKTMTVIQKTIELIRDRGVEVNILQVPLDDEKSYTLMAAGDATGVFQLESSGMRDTLRRMKPNRFGDIIALVALYRPGPMDNIPRYIETKDGKAAPDYMHEKLQPLLEETYGIMVYQEQVMQAAQALSGYSLGGADLLRRAMGKKIPAEMAAQRKNFVEGAVEHSGISAERASEIFDQIDKFAGYGFNKSHAAAYALIAYWTAWLKANHPVEFMAASMTLDQGNTDKLAMFKQELDRMGIKLLPPDINLSGASFRVEGDAVRYALAALKGVGEQAMVRLVAERDKRGPYKGIQDLGDRLEPGVMNKRQFEHLACAGAFDSLEPNRTRVCAAAETVLRHAQAQEEERQSGQVSLFGAQTGVAVKMELPDVPEWDPLEKLQKEFEAVGFFLSAHPLDAKAAQFARMGIVPVADVPGHLAHRSAAVLDMAGVLIKKQIKVSPKNGNKYAFLQLSDATGVYEVTLFSETLAAAKNFLNEGEALLLKVTVETREDQMRYTVQSLKPLDAALSAKIREVHVTVENEKSLSQLKTLLETEGKGSAKITVLVPTKPGVTAELTLPGRWNFSGTARNTLLRAGARVSEL